MLQKDNLESCALHQQVVSCTKEFAPLPNVAMRIMTMVADPESTAGDLEAILQSDVSLVAAVLKLANSAFYGVRRLVDSLRHALLLLGKSEVQSLVMSRVMFQAFKVPEGAQKSLMANVWKHSLQCALAAESIAGQIGEESPVYFLGGMLHDIGKLVVIQNFVQEIGGSEQYAEMDDAEGLEVEFEVLGCGHDELGAILLHRWMFPEELEEIVREHHNYIGIKDCSRVCQVMILADLLSRWLERQELYEKGERKEAAVIALRGILLRCGEDSGIIPSEGALVQMENAYRKRLEERADLLEMLSM